ncbi:hypothetical protein [Mumia sp. ZJ1417]|uniref:hypothetical protein n=1 Tax=Mumia sp. ZJ1417 TaxID=2708082 RepID=UPI001FB9704A|nr:hypothetical protein [Mumia sp. ZJ1417]
MIAEGIAIGANTRRRRASTRCAASARTSRSGSLVRRRDHDAGVLQNPSGAAAADFAGWNRAYRQYFANTSLSIGTPVLVPLGTAAPGHGKGKGGH